MRFRIFLQEAELADHEAEQQRVRELIIARYDTNQFREWQRTWRAAYNRLRRAIFGRTPAIRQHDDGLD